MSGGSGLSLGPNDSLSHRGDWWHRSLVPFNHFDSGFIIYFSVVYCGSFSKLPQMFMDMYAHIFFPIYILIYLPIYTLTIFPSYACGTYLHQPGLP